MPNIATLPHYKIAFCQPEQAIKGHDGYFSISCTVVIKNEGKNGAFLYSKS